MATPARKIYKVIENDRFTDSPNVVLSAVDKLVNFVKPTLGPKIRHILVDFGFKTELVDDGVTIAREFELEDEFEDAVASYVKEASQLTDDKAGDGTTTTMVILQTLLRELELSGLSYPDVKRRLKDAVAKAIEGIKAQTVEVKTEEDLQMVAQTSMDDEVISKLVAEVVWKTGAKGAVTISEVTGREVSYERLEGFAFGRGFVAKGMINDKKEQRYMAPNANFPGPVAIAVVEQTIATQADIVPILKALEQSGLKNIAIFCNNIIGEALGIIALNQMRGAFNIVGVQLMGQGDKAKDFVGDLCTVTGAKSPVGEFKTTDFGQADRIEVTGDDTTIVGGKGEVVDIANRVALLQRYSEDTKDSYEQEYYHQRQARLQQGIVEIRVGGVTETEVKLRLKKIEDAVNACKCALEEGICPGAGMTLYSLKTGFEPLDKALKSVTETLVENAEITETHLIEVDWDQGQTINTITGENGDFLEIGVVDATKVLRVAVENACSIAEILFSTKGIITSKRAD